MECPKCRSSISEVLKTVPRKDRIYRLRRCLHCKETFSTSERRNPRRKRQASVHAVAEVVEYSSDSHSQELSDEDREASVRLEHARR